MPFPPNELIAVSAENRALAVQMSIIPEIYSNDFIFQYGQRVLHNGDREKATRYYYLQGKGSAIRAREIIDEVIRVKKRLNQEWNPHNIMDFACGFGNLTRHLQTTFPESLVTGCDIHEKAVDFNREILGITTILSSYTPENVVLPKQDVILVLSFFSHLPKQLFTRWIRVLGLALAPGGALIFTARGHVAHKLANLGITVDETGFGFSAVSEQFDLPGEVYGTTVSYSRYVLNAIAECPEIRLVGMREGYWWNIQDTYVCIAE